MTITIIIMIIKWVSISKKELEFQINSFSNLIHVLYMASPETSLSSAFLIGFHKLLI